MTYQHRALKDCISTWKLNERFRQEMGEIKRCLSCGEGFVELKHEDRNGAKGRYRACTDWTHRINKHTGNIRKMMEEIR